MEPKIAYVVTRGEYSDYRICGVYLTQEEAGEAATFFGGDIEEWQVGNVPRPPKGMMAWRVIMGRDGTTHHAYGETHEDIGEDERFSESWAFHMWARDKEHAVKIANERRVQLIANNQWEE